MTITRPVQIEGVGLHTGKFARVTLSPAPPHSGIMFRSGGQEIAARSENVVDTTRCTVLGQGNVRISTVEHLLSACAGLGVTGLVVEIEGPELPIGDGSAQIWVEALQNAGITPPRSGEGSLGTSSLSPLPAVLSLETPPSITRLPSPLRGGAGGGVIVTGKNGAFVAAYPSDTLRVTVCASFDHPLVGTQVARFAPSRENASIDYAEGIAPARTFGFIEEVEALQKAGLALGGSLDNAVVVYPDHYSRPLRFPDELARHKLLDVLGDLNLAFGGAGVPIADIIAVKPSHTLNVEAARRIVAQSNAPVLEI